MKTGKLTRMPRAEQWAGQIRAQLGKSVESIVQVGHLLIKAKSDLDHGEFGRMFADELVPFGQNMAERFMRIANNALLSNSANYQSLPPAVFTLYDLSRVDQAKLQNALRDGAIKPDMPRKDIKFLLPSKPKPEPEGFHWMNAVGDLKFLIEKAIARWPMDARSMAPQALRELADVLESELADVDRGQGDDRSVAGLDSNESHGAALPA